MSACRRQSRLLSKVGDSRLYFVHSFRATPSPENDDWILATTKYGKDFISVIERSNISATQFHPEKSGAAGLAVLKGFLERESLTAQDSQHSNGRPSQEEAFCLPLGKEPEQTINTCSLSPLFTPWLPLYQLAGQTSSFCQVMSP